MKPLSTLFLAIGLILAVTFIPYLGILFLIVISLPWLYNWFIPFTQFSLSDTSPISEDAQLAVFKNTKYHYLKSEQWKLKRQQVLARDIYQCQVCKSTSELHIHHLAGYDKLPNEPISNLVTLCATCHEAQHNYFGYPQTYKEYMSWNVTLLKANNVN